jgi:2-dehydro-3-deoxygluconokinase
VGHERLLQSPRLGAHFGGAEANVAVSLARFGNDAAMISIVPPNPLGRAAVAELKKHGVDTSGVLERPGRMGLYFLEQGGGLRPADVLYDRVDSAFALAPPDTIDWPRALKGARWLHVSGITPAVGERAADAARRATEAAAALGVDVSFDGNYREKLWALWKGDPSAILRDLLSRARIAFVDDRDIALVLGTELDATDVLERRRASAALAFAAFPRLQAIYSTLRYVRDTSTHELGAALFTRHREFLSRTYSLHAIVDRIGSGDAFAAGVLHGIAAGYGDQQTLELGAAGAALKHSVPGDFNLVDLADVERLLSAPAGDVRR